MARSQVECASERDVYARHCIAIARYNDGMCAFRLCAVRYIVIGGGSMCALHVPPYLSHFVSRGPIDTVVYFSRQRVGKRTNDRVCLFSWDCEVNYCLSALRVHCTLLGRGRLIAVCKYASALLLCVRVSAPKTTRT